MYDQNDVLPVKRSQIEKENFHPLMEGYYGHRYSQAFSRDDVRQTVIPAYMGLITQIDDQIRRIVNYLKESGQAEETLIVFTFDHGDYLGDHWLREKELFHEQSLRIPLIIMDPSKAANNTRGSIVDDLTEAIDLALTFNDFLGGKVPNHILEGHSLMPASHGGELERREFAISEYDYSARPHLRHLSPDTKSCALTMIFDGRWKMNWVEGHWPMLYDLETYPDEFIGLGNLSEHKDQIERLSAALFHWARKQHSRVTISDEEINSVRCCRRYLSWILG